MYAARHRIPQACLSLFFRYACSPRKVARGCIWLPAYNNPVVTDFISRTVNGTYIFHHIIYSGLFRPIRAIIDSGVRRYGILLYHQFPVETVLHPYFQLFYRSILQYETTGSPCSDIIGIHRVMRNSVGCLIINHPVATVELTERLLPFRHFHTSSADLQPGSPLSRRKLPH